MKLNRVPQFIATQNSKQIVVFVRAVYASQAKMNALVQARQQFGSGAGSVTIVGCKEAK
jgi:hypothetical protein